ncbi:AF4/FMR2 family member lilli-like isoform X1 [Pollicipes pollicipes]|uniref:AF4/FMR2 family member lilli-like isoform X1 n=1 Tax=Pollicipes pollicipes TaxID=41117 RepID=UPI0018851E12|nr:AF4/FMR2 family member lilli-like isoform X1 [Pollicipes pollicipes]
MTLKLIRYTQAVIYFLLTALSMEKDSDDTDAMSAMLNDTLKLIKSATAADPTRPSPRDMLRLSAATYRKQGKRPTHTDHKLQTLLLRCQGLIYLRMFKLREAEHKKAQRQVAEFKMLSEPLSADEPTCSVPIDLFRLMLRCNEIQTHLQNWLDCWEQADELMQMAQDTAEFFAELDRTMGGLLATSSLLELVYYIRETTRRLQEMHNRAVV